MWGRSAIKLKRTDTTLDLSQERQREGKEKRAGFRVGWLSHLENIEFFGGGMVLEA